MQALFPFCLVSLMLSFLPGPAIFAQTLHYDVIRSDEVIGEMWVSREQSGAQEIFRSNTEIEVRMLIKVALKFTYEAHFEDGVLVKALVRNYRDGKLRDETRINPDPAGIRVQREDESFLIEEPVTYTILQAYFQPPGSRQEVFSERWGRYQPFVAVADGRCVMYIANGDKSYYQYQGGHCQEIELDMTLATLYMRRRE